MTFMDKFLCSRAFIASTIFSLRLGRATRVFWLSLKIFYWNANTLYPIGADMSTSCYFSRLEESTAIVVDKLRRRIDRRRENSGCRGS